MSDPAPGRLIRGSTRRTATPLLLSESDETLAHALMAGDRRAPHVAWKRFAPRVYAILKRTFGPGNDVDDLHQDVFIAFFRKVPALRDPKALEAFIVSITVRTIKRELRRRRTWRFLSLSETAADVDKMAADLQGSPASSAEAEWNQNLAAFYAILDRLNPQDRTAFNLRYLEGLELLPVSLMLGMSLSTTKRRLARIWRRVAARVRSDTGLSENGRRRSSRDVDHGHAFADLDDDQHNETGDEAGPTALAAGHAHDINPVPLRMPASGATRTARRMRPAPCARG